MKINEVVRCRDCLNSELSLKRGSTVEVEGIHRGRGPALRWCRVNEAWVEPNWFRLCVHANIDPWIGFRPIRVVFPAEESGNDSV